MFVKYNLELRRRYDAHDRNEWLLGQTEKEIENDELVFED